MLLVQSQALPPSMSEEVTLFCHFAFAGTQFKSSIIEFKSFDPTNVCKALTDVQEIGLVITYNLCEEDTIEDILEVLAHESVHAHQLSEGRLKYAILKTKQGLEHGFMWNGKPYTYPATAMEVVKLPWEIEAIQRTPEILAGFKKSKFRNKPRKK